MRRIEVEVERLVHGPGALARDSDGRVVLLDGGLPGERALADVVEERRDFLRARVVQLVSHVSSRREAPCPIVAECGGCPWQHIDYARQIELKLDVILREIRRACRVEPETVLPSLAGEEWRSRQRIRVAIERPHSEPPRLGFRARGAKRVVPLDDCVIAHPALVAALPLARALAASLASAEEIELTLDDAASLRLLGWVEAAKPIEAGALFARLERECAGRDLLGARFVGLVLVSRARGGREWLRSAGDVVQRITPTPELTLGVPVGVFSQVNLTLNRQLVAEVVRATQAGPGRNIVDFYCGAGNFALPLARAGAQVVAIDADVRAIGAAHHSATQLGLAERVRFVALPVERAALQGRLPERIDACVLDPPRSGAARALPGILGCRPEAIVYVSCDAATFARDARTILAAGYAFSSLRLVDLTPQTFRAEVVGVFRLTC